MKKLVCLALAMFMLLSLTACPNTRPDNAAVSSSFTISEVQSEDESKPSLKEETSSSPKTSSAVTSANNHKHQYEKTVMLQSCGQEGGDVYTCECGDSYKRNVVAPTYKHDFLEEKRTVGEDTFTVFVCVNCGTEALYVAEWWKYKAQFDDVRWYISGKINIAEDGKSHYESDYEIVVCGKGAIEDFNKKTGNPPWHSFLGSKLKSITVTGGITSIGNNAFNYRTSKKQEVNFYIGGSVKTIKSGAIRLNVNDIILQNGVEVIEKDAISGVRNIYLPESVMVCHDIGTKSTANYYYEGNLDSLLEIQVKNPEIAGNPPCTLKELCDWYSENNKSSDYLCTVIMSSPEIRKGSALFDGKTVKTDPESLKMYIE